MMRRCALALVTLASVGLAAPSAGPPPQPDGVAELLGRLERTLGPGIPSAYLDLLSTLADRADAAAFAAAAMSGSATRVVVRERDRAPLFGTLPGDG